MSQRSVYLEAGFQIVSYLDNEVQKIPCVGVPYRNLYRNFCRILHWLEIGVPNIISPACEQLQVFGQIDFACGSNERGHKIIAILPELLWRGLPSDLPDCSLCHCESLSKILLDD